MRIAKYFLMSMCLASQVSASTIEPTWSELVITDYQDVNPRTGEPAVTTESQPYAGNGFFAESTASQYGRGMSYVSLVDFQGPHGAVTVDVVLAYWGHPGSAASDPVPLDVLSYPAAAVPPQLTGPPTGSLIEQVEAVPGETVQISWGSRGSECFLFQIDAGFPYGSGGPAVSGTIDPGSVPEPSSVAIFTALFLPILVFLIREESRRK